MKKMFKSPKALKAALCGVCCQFILMPVVAYALTLIFRIEGFTAYDGVVLAGCMPGGSSSNIYAMWGESILEERSYDHMFNHCYIRIDY